MDMRAAFVDTLQTAAARDWHNHYHNSDLSRAHAEDMLRRWDTEVVHSEAKQGRWLGWLQGVICALGFLTLNEVKEINRRHNENADQSPGDAWQPIATAPRDGTVVDLWIVGCDDTVDFYAVTAKKVRGQAKRHGRAPNMCWLHKPPNNPNWYPVGGLGYPLSPDVVATHWRPLPEPPK